MSSNIHSLSTLLSCYHSSLNSFFGSLVRTHPAKERGYRFFGTSASAPNVAAVAAVLLGVARDLDIPMRPQRLYRVLERTATDIIQPNFDYDSGHGMVNAMAAVEKLLRKAGAIQQRRRRATLPAYCDYVNDTMAGDGDVMYDDDNEEEDDVWMEDGNIFETAAVAGVRGGGKKNGWK